MNKKDIYVFTRKAYKRLKDDDFTFRFANLRGLHGLCDIGDKRIQLNPKGEILNTLVHEILHDVNPDWSETKVLKEESRIMARLSYRQMINLILALGEALKRSH